MVKGSQVIVARLDCLRYKTVPVEGSVESDSQSCKGFYVRNYLDFALRVIFEPYVTSTYVEHGDIQLYQH